MKKLLALLMAAAMLLCILGACAGKQTETPAEPEPEAAPSEAAPAPEETPADTSEAPAEEETPAPEEAPVEETGYIGLEEAMKRRVSYELPICTTGETYTAFFTVSDRNELTSIHDGEWYEMVGINIERTDVPNSVASEKLNLAIAAETYYDIMPMSTSGSFPSADAAVEDGVLWDFSEYLDEYMPNYSVLIHSDPEYESAAYTDGGAVFSLMQFYHVPYTSDYGPMIRLDMLEGVGMDIPLTFDDWDKVLRAVKAEYDLEATFSISQSGVGRNNYFCAGYGIAGEVGLSPMMNIPLYVYEDTVHFGAMEDEFFEYLCMMSDWYADGILYKDYYTNTGWSPISDIIYDGQCFAWQDDNRMIDVYQANLTDPNAKIWPVPDPVKELGNNHYLASSIRLTEGGNQLSTTLLDKDWETFLKCMDFAYSPECDYLLTYGLEGEAYELDENGVPQYTDLITNNPDGYTYTEAKQLYGFGTMSGCILFSEADNVFKSEASIEAQTAWDRSDGDVETMPTDVALTTEESEGYTLLISDIATYCGEMITKFIVGEADVRTGWDEYVDTIKSMKIDEALAYQQAAYDRYIGRAG